MTNCVNNIAIGHNALTAATGGVSNVAIGGNGAGMAITTADRIVAIGDGALGGAAQSDGNTGVGYACLYSATGAKNTAFGYQTSNTVTSGTENTVVGWDADASASGAVNQTVIGSETTGQADNSVTLGNSSVTAVYMAQDSGATVHCAGVVVSEGINFPDDAATGHSSDVNTLDNYEEGTWTPVLCNLSATGQEMTMNGEQAGTYVKIGRVVHLSINCGAGGNGTATNSDMAIKNLPFACGGSSTTDRGFRASFHVSSAGGLNLPDGNFLVGFLNAATQVIELRKVDVDPSSSGESGNTSQVSRDELSVNGGFVMSGTYIS
jgi:hypothetical protein